MSSASFYSSKFLVTTPTIFDPFISTFFDQLQCSILQLVPSVIALEHILPTQLFVLFENDNNSKQQHYSMATTLVSIYR